MHSEPNRRLRRVRPFDAMAHTCRQFSQSPAQHTRFLRRRSGMAAAPDITQTHSSWGWSYQKPGGLACPVETIRSIRAPWRARISVNCRLPARGQIGEKIAGASHGDFPSDVRLSFPKSGIRRPGARIHPRNSVPVSRRRCPSAFRDRRFPHSRRSRGSSCRRGRIPAPGNNSR